MVPFTFSVTLEQFTTPLSDVYRLETPHTETHPKLTLLPELTLARVSLGGSKTRLSQIFLAVPLTFFVPLEQLWRSRTSPGRHSVVSRLIGAI